MITPIGNLTIPTPITATAATGTAGSGARRSRPRMTSGGSTRTSCTLAHAAKEEAHERRAMPTLRRHPVAYRPRRRRYLRRPMHLLPPARRMPDVRLSATCGEALLSLRRRACPERLTPTHRLLVLDLLSSTRPARHGGGMTHTCAGQCGTCVEQRCAETYQHLRSWLIREIFAALRGMGAV